MQSSAYSQRPGTHSDLGSTTGEGVLLDCLLLTVFIEFLIPRYTLKKQLILHDAFFFFFSTHRSHGYWEIDTNTNLFKSKGTKCKVSCFLWNNPLGTGYCYFSIRIS